MKKINNENKNGSRSAKANLRQSSWLKKIGNIPPFAHVILIVILLLIVFLLFTINKRKDSSPLYLEALKYSEENSELTLHHNVFGDHFVNNLFINNKNTNFYYDNITTAYIFKPQYT